MAEKFTLTVNGNEVTVEADGDTPLLWVLRDSVGLKGTKFGCGIAQCGACTVFVDGLPLRSCSFTLNQVAGSEVTTIEGLPAYFGTEGLHPVQQAWIDEQVPQCGYCQSGQIMSAVALLEEIDDPTDDDIDSAMAGNICRCGTYPRIRKAIKNAAKALRS